MADTERLLSVREVAERLSVHPETVRRYLRDGTLPGRHLKQGWRVKESDVAAFIESDHYQPADRTNSQP